jgi:large subunit ribosomal protein L13
MEENFTMNNTTYSAKKSEIERKWYIIDAENKPLGRVATEAAKLLRGKHKPTYTPNIDCGDHVIVINCDKAILTGNKMNDKKYTHFTGYIGNMKEISAKDLMAKDSTKAMMHAIKGMLPHNTLGRQMLTKVRLYKGAEHDNQAQKPEVWEY